MNKAKLVESMAKITKILNLIVKKLWKRFISSVGSALKQNKDVVLTGFGTFTVMKRKSRVGVNPATGKKMQIPAKRVPKFRAGKAFKING